MIRAQERQAAALEELARIASNNFGGVGATREIYEEDDRDFLISSDRDTFYRELDEASRISKSSEEE